MILSRAGDGSGWEPDATTRCVLHPTADGRNKKPATGPVVLPRRHLERRLPEEHPYLLDVLGRDADHPCLRIDLLRVEDPVLGPCEVDALRDVDELRPLLLDHRCLDHLAEIV